MEQVTKFAERLLSLREEHNETQAELASSIGITRQSLSRYEMNERTPNIDLIYSIAKHYDVSADYLLGLSDVKNVDIDFQTICKITGLTEKSLNIILEIKASPKWLTDKKRACYKNQTLLDTFNAIIEAINYLPSTLLELNRLTNLSYTFKGEEEFKKNDITVYEAFKKAFPKASAFLDNKMALFTNTEYSRIMKKQAREEFKLLVDYVIGTYNPEPIKLGLGTNFYDMHDENSLRMQDTLLKRFEQEKEFHEYRMKNPLEKQAEKEEKEFEEYMKTPEYKEREANGELKWFEYSEEISKIKYKELIDRLIEISTEERDLNADNNPEEE